MAKFNTESIENFDAMTAEEKVAALLEAEIPDDVDMRKFVSKELFDKATSDRAALSRQLKEKEDALKSKATEQMTEDEKWQEKLREIQETYEQKINETNDQLDALQRKDKLRETQTGLALLGFDEKLSKDSAEALVDARIPDFISGLKKFLEAYRKKVETDVLNSTPRPGGSSAVDQEKMNPALEYVQRRAAERSRVTKQAEESRNQFFR